MPEIHPAPGRTNHLKTSQKTYGAPGEAIGMVSVPIADSAPTVFHADRAAVAVPCGLQG